MSKRPEKKRPIPAKGKAVEPSVPNNPPRANLREGWDLFNLGVAAYTLPMRVRLLFGEAQDRGISPQDTDRAEGVVYETLMLRESARRLAPTPAAEAAFQDALDALVTASPTQMTRRQFLMATGPVVGACHPRLPMFTFGTEIGRWQHTVIDEVEHLLETSPGRLLGGDDEPVRPGSHPGYATPSLAPIFMAAVGISLDDRAGIGPIQRLAAAWCEDQDAVAIRNLVHEYAPVTACNTKPWVQDIEAVKHLEAAVFRALECAAAGRPSSPCWDKDTLTLRYQGCAVRKYAAQANSVKRVLDLFHEAEWREYVVLPHDLSYRVHDVVKSMNSGLERTGLRFRANWRDKLVLWEVKAT